MNDLSDKPRSTRCSAIAGTWRFAATLGFVVSCGLVACTEPELPEMLPVLDLEPESILVSSPMIERDLDEIQASGTLRVLMRNSSSSYHVLRGEEFGFEFELARRLARDLGVQLQVILPESQYSLMSQLNLGQADLIAAPLIPHAPEAAPARYTQPYGEVELTLVVHEAMAEAIASPEDLEGVMVASRRWSNEERALLDLREQGIHVGMVMLSPQTSSEEILEMVADGTYPAAVAHSNIAQATLKLRSELRLAFPLSRELPICWAVRSNSPRLGAAVDAFLQSHYQLREDGQATRSQLYNILHAKYFSDTNLILSREEDPFHLARTGRLSPFDDLFRASARRYDLDWRLLASVAFQESRFDPDQKSWAGAVGLMQVRPRTVGAPEEKLYEPELNIELGAKHLRSLFDAYRFLDDDMQLIFALAAYNAGQGHLDDARFLAIMRGKDPNAWKGSVRTSLLLLRKPEYHRQVRYGYVRGTETVDYVDRVLRRYELFCQVVPREISTDVVFSEPQSELPLLD